MKNDLHTYESDDIAVTYDAARCIHAARCVERLPAVFDPDRRPWIQPDAADAEAVAEAVRACPTGALHYARAGGARADDEEPVPTENTVAVDPDGPLYLRGDIVLKDADGHVLLRDTRVALCRCGLSENKPLCDNSHVDQFEAGAALGATGTEEIEDPSGTLTVTLTVTLAAGGPLVLHGPFRLEGDAEARTYAKGALCRCGRSASKPFCDGTHREAGFTTAD